MTEVDNILKVNDDATLTEKTATPNQETEENEAFTPNPKGQEETPPSQSSHSAIDSQLVNGQPDIVYVTTNGTAVDIINESESRCTTFQGSKADISSLESKLSHSLSSNEDGTTDPQSQANSVASTVFTSIDLLENGHNSITGESEEPDRCDGLQDSKLNVSIPPSPETLRISSESFSEVSLQRDGSEDTDILPAIPASEKIDVAQVQEDPILTELNDVLTNLGFDIRRVHETKGSLPHDTEGNFTSDVNVGAPLTLQDFTSSLQFQLSKYKLASEKFRDDHYTEVQSLENALAQERLRFEQLETSTKQALAQLKNELEKKKQQFDAVNKDKEAMVIKYAMGEKLVMTVRKDLELAERRLKEANRARDLLSERLKAVQSEKEKANNLLETKGQELSTLNREHKRLKEDLRWTQNKLKTETDGKKEAEQRVTDLIRKLEEARLEVTQAGQSAKHAIKSYQESEENKAVSLDHQLREQQAKLIIERHGRADTEMTLKQLQLEVDTYKSKQQALINENNQWSLKVQTLEKERLDCDQKLSRLKQETDKHQQEVADLREKVAEMESLRAQLQHYEDQLGNCRNEMERLRQTNVELQQDTAACREREAELLDFTQKLTEKNVRLQSEFSALEARAQMLESEHQPLKRKLAEVESRLESVTKELEQEKKERLEEKTILARHLAESTHCLEQTQQQLEDSQGEIEVLKRKHAASIRELTREIQQSRKRQEMMENSAGGSHHSSNSNSSIAQGSRTSSSSSLNTVCEPVQSPTLPPITFPNGQEPDKQVLIERLVKLQRENAKKAEKLDFMEEHAQVLVGELQKKTRLIQSFVMKMPAGALSSETMDQNKADLAKRTGIMASMYGTKNDETMSLELSMEINRKLQAVLEDTLLKNITLKENIDTLGGEIARLATKSTNE